MSTRYAVYLCGGDIPSDGQWHKLGYVEATNHKCDSCSFCSEYSRLTDGETKKRRQKAVVREFRCGKCLRASTGAVLA